MGKYIDKMPHSGGDPKQIEDYLAYLKDQLNFIFDNYWRNIKGAVTFESLKEPGKTVIDGGNVTTGRMASKNGGFYVDLETGEALLKNAQILGGKVWIETDDEEASIIRLRLSRAVQEDEVDFRAGGVFVSRDNNGDFFSAAIGSEGIFSQMFQTPVRYVNRVNVDGPALGMFLTNENGERVAYAENGFVLSQYDQLNDEFVKRAEMDVNGLTFYDAAGNVTASYPAVQ